MSSGRTSGKTLCARCEDCQTNLSVVIPLALGPIACGKQARFTSSFYRKPWLHGNFAARAEASIAAYASALFLNNSIPEQQPFDLGQAEDVALTDAVVDQADERVGFQKANAAD